MAGMGDCRHYLLHHEAGDDNTLHSGTTRAALNPSTTMSAPSGIKVPDDLTAAFTTALTSPHDTRALVFIIDGGP